MEKGGNNGRKKIWRKETIMKGKDIETGDNNERKRYGERRQ